MHGERANFLPVHAGSGRVTPMFIASLTYVKDLSEVEAHLPDHVAYLEHYYGQGIFLMSGRKEPRNGGVIVMQADSREQVEKIISEDPFNQASIAEYEITEFIPTKTAPELEGYRRDV